MATKPKADPFAAVREATLAHIRQHGCGCYPYFDGSVLGVIAGASGAKRIVELGTALGYSAIWFAHGAPDAHVDTVEGDAEHVRIARGQIAAAGFADRVSVHHGDFKRVLATLAPGYDLGFFDGHGPTPALLAGLRRLLRPRGVLIATNLDFDGEAAPVRKALADPAQWLANFAVENGRTAIAVKQG
jgi:predicted O-methyltransferase YrrM